jgi:hypothetical protein
MLVEYMSEWALIFHCSIMKLQSIHMSLNLIRLSNYSLAREKEKPRCVEWPSMRPGRSNASRKEVARQTVDQKNTNYSPND